MRSSLRWLHSAFGLAGAIWLFLLGITGTLLVFYTELDHALNSEMFRPAGTASIATVDEAVATVTASAAGRQVEGFWRGNNEADIWTFRVSPAPPGTTLEVYLDPTIGRVTGERVWHELTIDRAHLMPVLYQLHYNLLMGAGGEWFIGLVGFFWLIDHFVALTLSFPTAAKWWHSFRIRVANGHKLTFDLHRSIGMWLLLVTLVIAGTGTYMNWRPYAETVVGMFSQRSPWPGSDLPELSMPLERPRLTMQDAIQVAAPKHFQGANYDPARGIYAVNAFDPRDLTSDYGRQVFVVDAISGKIRSSVYTGSGTAADVMEAWLLPLHNGKAAGFGGRIVVALSGVALCSFVITGLMIWWRRRTSRRVHLRKSSRPYPESW